MIPRLHVLAQHMVARQPLLRWPFFTEPKDTLDYLQQKITARIGDPAAVVVVHGGIAREARRAAIAAFNSDPVVRER